MFVASVRSDFKFGSSMAAPAHPQSNPDPVVTVKMAFEGTTRRAKMHLREMTPQTLEEQIRSFLRIPPGAHMVLERYSDSAGTYVLIEPGNMTVYKQLYRAAKAKSKLKLRIFVSGQPSKTLPRPASVEDAPDAEAASLSAESSKVYTSVHTSGQTQNVARATPPAPPQQKAAFAGNSTGSSSVPDGARHNAVVIKPSEPTTPAWPLGLKEHQVNDITRASERGAPRFNKGPATMTPEVLADLSRSLAQSMRHGSFAVCCNNCEKQIPDAHYHCSTCDMGDFDLCQSCVDHGVACYSDDHWLIKRTLVNGEVVNSTTETIAPKPKTKTKPKQTPMAATELPAVKLAVRPIAKPVAPKTKTSSASPALPRPVVVAPCREAAAKPALSGAVPTSGVGSFAEMRTCNCCVEEKAAAQFVHCTTCADYDLCVLCFGQGNHGHHPNHGFSPAVADTVLPDRVLVKLGPGRNQVHHAVCDGCDKYIYGVRHKCLDCPDWDYCSSCIVDADFVHRDHRFVPIYDPLKPLQASTAAQTVHHGICCDGPLCVRDRGYPSYIRGVRYKCAVCHDLDFCANCEASPANEHNKTHPLIKFKTPVRHVCVTTTGEHENGVQMPPMGDRGNTDSKATETVNLVESNAINAVRTVVDVKPAETSELAYGETVKQPGGSIREETPEDGARESESAEKSLDEKDLKAVFLQDTVADGTIMAPNSVFEQTWTLRNEGNVTWPAGCSVQFVGGDYMGHIDSAHPAGISELVSASESTICYGPLAPGQEFAFTALLRTPARLGKVISYWRLTTPDGQKFGHRLWCEVNVRNSKSSTPVQVPTPEVKTDDTEPDVKTEEVEQTAQSTMIFPKLEKESPMSSIHAGSQAEPRQTEEKSGETDDFDDVAVDEEWDGSEDGFLTDEEYDILDASDEEFLEEQEKKMMLKK